MAKKKQKPRKNRIFRLCIFAFVVYSAVVLIDMQVTIATRRQEMELLEARVEQQRIANKELERQLANGVDEEYIEQVARDRLDFVDPDERVFIDISGS